MFDAAFQVCPQVLDGVQVRRVGWERHQIHSVVVEPGLRAARLVIGSVVLKVEPRAAGPEEKSGWLHEPLHSVGVQSGVHGVVKDSQCAHSFAAETRPDADLGCEVSLTLNHVLT